MVNNCCVVGCSNRVGKKKKVSFYRFPWNDKGRCDKWKASVRRSDWEPTIHTRICSEHFVSGKISTIKSVILFLCFILQIGKPHPSSSHPDYVPTVFPPVYHTGSAASAGSKQAFEKKLERADRRMQRHNERRRLDELFEAEKKKEVERKKQEQEEKRKNECEMRQKVCEEKRKRRKEIEKQREVDEVAKFTVELETEKRKREREEEDRKREKEEQERCMIEKEQERKQEEEKKQQEVANRKRLVHEIEEEKNELEETIFELREE